MSLSPWVWDYRRTSMSSFLVGVRRLNSGSHCLCARLSAESLPALICILITGPIDLRSLQPEDPKRTRLDQCGSLKVIPGRFCQLISTPLTMFSQFPQSSLQALPPLSFSLQGLDFYVSLLLFPHSSLAGLCYFCGQI